MTKAEMKSYKLCSEVKENECYIQDVIVHPVCMHFREM